ncbi:unnamed protein product, partial [Ectocarpus sp. 12 AP-2014]
LSRRQQVCNPTHTIKSDSSSCGEDVRYASASVVSEHTGSCCATERERNESLTATDRWFIHRRPKIPLTGDPPRPPPHPPPARARPMATHTLASIANSNLPQPSASGLTTTSLAFRHGYPTRRKRSAAAISRMPATPGGGAGDNNSSSLGGGHGGGGASGAARGSSDRPQRPPDVGGGASSSME